LRKCIAYPQEGFLFTVLHELSLRLIAKLISMIKPVQAIKILIIYQTFKHFQNFVCLKWIETGLIPPLASIYSLESLTMHEVVLKKSLSSRRNVNLNL
jgi:hypothetical protein